MRLAQETFIHEDWTGRVEDGNDIALIKLSQKSKKVPVGLPSSVDKLDAGQRFVAIGWGLRGVGKNVWGPIIKDSMLCAFNFGGQEICEGELQSWASFRVLLTPH